MDYIHPLCKRVLELDELYMKFQILTGYTAEQLLELFAKGYELTPPDPPMSLSEFAFQEDLNIKEETENTNNAHIKIQYNYEELSVSEICKRLTEAEDRAEKAESERDAAVEMLKKANDETGNCYGCKYFYAKKQVCTDKEKKIVCDCGENNMWEWRGLQKEE